MLFRRRIPKSVALQLREWVWPTAGWRRTLYYGWHRLRRLPGGTHSVAAGFAFGAAVSFMPLNGLHFAAAALLAWLFRSNVLASAIGTFIGNPWTFPLIWWGTYQLGRIMLGYPASAAQVDFGPVFIALWYGVQNLDIGHLARHVWPIWWPMFVGSIPVAIVSWFAVYWLLKHGMVEYHRRHGLRRLRKLARQARAAQGDDDHHHYQGGQE